MRLRDLLEWAARPRTKWPYLQTLVRSFYAVLRLIVPTNPEQIAFGSHPDCSDNAYALFEYVMASPAVNQFRVIWLAKSVSEAEYVLDRDYPGRDPSRVKIVRKDSLLGFWSFLRSKYVFFTHSIYWFVRSSYHQKLVNLWHGMPIKSIGQYEHNSGIRIRSRQYLIATSSFFANIMAESFLVKSENVLVTGLPRNTWLQQPDNLHRRVSESRSKLVVWMPTFRKTITRGYCQVDITANANDPLEPSMLDFLDEELEGSDVLLLVKLHPFDLKNTLSWSCHRNIRVYTDTRFREQNLNIYKLLACSDALITDYSSIAIDYLLLNRPIAFFMPDFSCYQRGFTPGVIERLSTAGRRISSVADLAKFIKSPLLPQERNKIQLEELHQSDLDSPSQSILHALGLESLNIRQDNRAQKLVGVVN